MLDLHTALMARLQAALEAATAEVARSVHVLAKATPLFQDRTGALRHSIGLQRKGALSWTVLAAKSYAGYVELGTRHMKPRPFMRLAAKEASDHATAIVERRLRGAMR